MRTFRAATIALALLGLTFAAAQADAATYTLGTSSLVVGSSSGTNSVVLAATPSTATWTATTNATWLHLTAANQSGTGSTDVIFSYDTNSGPTRIGTLTIASQTLTVTQAGSTYVSAGTNTVLVSGLNQPQAVAVDMVNNVYIADGSSGAIYKWLVASNTLTTLVSSASFYPMSVALNGGGPVYFANIQLGSATNAVDKWAASTFTLTTLASAGLNKPYGVAVDASGNVYIADTGNNAIKEWTIVNSNVITLVSTGLNSPTRIALDTAGNMYIADYSNNAIEEWMAATSNVITLVSSGLNSPSGVAVDASGNVYIADAGNNAIKKWTVANNTLSTLVSSGLSGPGGPAVDALGNVYMADTGNGSIKQLSVAFVDPTPKMESLAAGNDSLPVVLPASENLRAPFIPTSDQSWLTITGTLNGVVNFAFSTNSGPSRTAHITLLGQTVPVTQAGYAYSLGTNMLSESAIAGSDSVILTVTPNAGAWQATANAFWLHLSASNQSGTGNTNVVFSFDANPGAMRSGTITIEGQTLTVTQSGRAILLGAYALLAGSTAGTSSVVIGAPSITNTWNATANTPWLHLSPANQSGTGSTNVIFTFDANSGTTRSGTLTIGGQTLTITQAGSTYVPAGANTVLATGLNQPQAVAVDGTGNVYIANGSSGAIDEWSPVNNTVSPLATSSSYYPIGIAVDIAGNVYFGSYYNGQTSSALFEWSVATGNVTALVSSGLNDPYGVAVDLSGNVYIADSGNNAIKEWTIANSNVVTLVSNGLNFPTRIALDTAGNVYIADYNNNAIKEWIAANSNVVTLVSAGLNHPGGVAVDGSGNVYIADYSANAMRKWTVANNTLTTLVSSGLSSPSGPAVDSLGNVYIADTGNGKVEELPFAFVNTAAMGESLAAGQDSLSTVLPAGENLLAPFAPASSQSWLTISGITNDVVSVAFTATPSTRVGYIALLGQNVPIVQGQETFTYSLSTNALLVGPATGSNSVILAVNFSFGTWTNVANASWLHLSPANQNGMGSTDVVFSYDTNSGPTRTGTLSIAGQTLTITQAGTTYVPAGAITTLAGSTDPEAVTVDGSGNVYIASGSAGMIAKWSPSNGTLTTLASSSSYYPVGIAADTAGNVYFANYHSGHSLSTVDEWTAANSNVTALVSTGLNDPYGVAVDPVGNVYIADTGNNAIKKWTVANSNVVTLVSTGLNFPTRLALDTIGNLYISDYNNNAVKEWTAVNSNVITLVSSGLNRPSGVAVDVSGDVYISSFGDGTMKKWTPAGSTLTTLVSSGLNGPGGPAVDSLGNVYIADSGNGLAKELPVAFVDPTARAEGLAAGQDSLPTVLPPAENLMAPFAPASSQPWLTISGVTNGVVSYSFTANNNPPRAANISLLGLTIPVTQVGSTYSLSTNTLVEGSAAGGDGVTLTVTPNSGSWTATTTTPWLHISAVNQSGTGSSVINFSFDADPGSERVGTINIEGLILTVIQNYQPIMLGASSLLVGPNAGTNSVVLGVTPATASWTATANDSWLQLSPAFQSGTGSTNVIFNFDANPGATRSGTLTIGGQTLTVTQAGATYVPAAAVNALVTFSGLLASRSVEGLAVDSSGNVVIADYAFAYDAGRIDKWLVASNSLPFLVSSSSYYPVSVAVDAYGNVFFASVVNGPSTNAVLEWSAANNSVTTLVSSGLSSFPGGVAVDLAGNVYIADSSNNAIKELTVSNNNLTTLVSTGLNFPLRPAVDIAGNVYFADYSNNMVKEWVAATGNVATLVSSGLSLPSGVAVDGSGNVYIADDNNDAVKEWSAVNNTVTKLPGSYNPSDVAVDGAANVYVSQNQGIDEIPHAFVDPTPKMESYAAGSDTLPLVLPSTENLSPPVAPTSDQYWLTVNGATNGIVTFSFSVNTAAIPRTGHINLLGQSISIIQGGSLLGTGPLVEGPAPGSDSVVLALNSASTPWTATANAVWLHFAPAFESGTGSTNMIFSFDANPGATRSGTLTIAGQTLTVTQAGSTYVPANPQTLLVSGVNNTDGIGVDAAGNVYMSVAGAEAVEKWNVASNAVTTLVSATLNVPRGLAADGAGNLYFPEEGSVIYKWTASNAVLSNLNIQGLNDPQSVALDAASNLYIADTFNDAVKVWTVANSNVTTLVSSGLSDPAGVAVDTAGNVYIADSGNNAIKEWIAANNSVITLVSSGLNYPYGVAVDGSGNVYIADYGNNAIKVWTAASNSVTTLVSSGLNQPKCVAVDNAHNVYIADTFNNEVKELPRAFVDTAVRLESLTAGNDALSPVLPATENLLPPFAPFAYPGWLTLTGITNDVVNYSFTGTASNRTGYINVLGQTIAVAQGAQSFNYSLSTNALLVGPAAGSNTVILAANVPFAPWANAANAPWLHLSPANQNGMGSTNVVFSYDTNSGPTRTGALTIAGQTLTITQAGSTYVPAGTNTIIASGLTDPEAVAVDGAGNVYVACGAAGTIDKWSPANNTLTTLVSSSSYYPLGVAVDNVGNVYFANVKNGASINSVDKWTAANNTVTTLVSSGLNSPYGVAVDAAGNVYIADTRNNAIKEWTIANSNVITLASTGLNFPTRLAVDIAGNVYLSDYNNNAVKEWLAATGTVTTLVSSGLSHPSGVAVDVSGNVYIGDYSANAVREWIVASNTLATLPSSGLNGPGGPAVDSLGNVYIADTGNGMVKEYPFAFVDPTLKVESLNAGQDSLLTVLPPAENLTVPFAPTNSQPWLTISGSTNGVVSFSFTASTSNRTGYITLLGQNVPIAQGAETIAYSLSTNALLAGPLAESNSVILLVSVPFGTWTNTANATWLHLSPANQNGMGSTNVFFSCDTNSGPTRTGTLTIAGQMLTITQAGSTYVSAGTNTVIASGLTDPEAVAVDGSGNVYVACGSSGTIDKWSPANNTLTALVSSSSYWPFGIAVDNVGNVYFANVKNGASISSIDKWTAANSNVTTLVSSGLNNPYGVAVDAAGNVYIADTGNNAIKEWTVANSNVATLVSSGLNFPTRLAVDFAGNVYLSDYNNNAVKEWVAGTGTMTTLVSSGLSHPSGVAMDVSGNVYIADFSASAMREWLVASNTLATLPSSGLNGPGGPAVDSLGNVYIADTGNGMVKEHPFAFVDPTPRIEGMAAGTDSLPVVLSASENLLAPFAPVSSQSWLAITGITDDVVNFAFTAASSNRIGYITILGQIIPIVQGTDVFTYSLSTNALLIGPTAGSNSIILAVNVSLGTWTNVANAPWLHLSPANQNGMGSTNVVFSYDPNSGPTRTGTLTIAGQTLTITQAGSTYVPAGTNTLFFSGLTDPEAVAVDGLGNVYVACGSPGQIAKLSLANHFLTSLVFSTSYYPVGIAVDITGNVYFANYHGGGSISSVSKWTAANSNVTTLVSSGLNNPYGVAVDAAGNVYIADTGNNAIKEWTVANSNVVTLVSSGLNFPTRLAVDIAGNVYFSDYNNNAVKEWVAANNTVTALVSSGLNHPGGVAIDVSGNVYIADYSANAIRKWTAAHNTLTTLVSSGLNGPGGPAIDGSGNLYIADTGNGAIKELPFAFVDTTTKFEVAAAGADSLPVVLPTSENLLAPFAPVSDQSWLTISGITNGVVGFSFTADSGGSRAGHITLLGQSVQIVQGTVTSAPNLTNVTMLSNGVLQFGFTDNPNATFTVLSATNILLPFTNWTVVGAASNISSNVFQFTSQPTTNDPQRFYRVSSP